MCVNTEECIEEKQFFGCHKNKKKNILLHQHSHLTVT